MQKRKLLSIHSSKPSVLSQCSYTEFAQTRSPLQIMNGESWAITRNLRGPPNFLKVLRLINLMKISITKKFNWGKELTSSWKRLYRSRRLARWIIFTLITSTWLLQKSPRWLKLTEMIWFIVLVIRELLLWASMPQTLIWKSRINNSLTIWYCLYK